jgi:hypothetical protein
MNRVSGRVATALVALGVVLAIAPAFMATITICGVSGCSGGGFGRATDPDATLVLLGLTGLVAALPLAVHALVRRSGGLAVGALALAVVTTFVTGVVIGSDLRGCPRSIDRDACLGEAR